MKLFSFRGIPLVLSRGWFAFIGIMALLLSLSSDTILESFFAICFLEIIVFSFVVLHEYGHSLAAQYFGYKVNEIELIPFGGMAKINGNFNNIPKHEFWITFWGPIVNVILAVLFYPLCILFPVETSTDILEVNGLYSLFCVLIDFSFEVNIRLFLFNLIPCYPMDGGRFLKSLLGFKFGPQKAAKAAFACAVIAGIPLCAWMIFNGHPIGFFLPLLILAGYGELKLAAEQVELAKFLFKPFGTEYCNDRFKFNSIINSNSEVLQLSKLIRDYTIQSVNLIDEESIPENRKLELFSEVKDQISNRILMGHKEIDIKLLIEEIRYRKYI